MSKILSFYYKFYLFYDCNIEVKEIDAPEEEKIDKAQEKNGYKYFIENLLFDKT